MATRAEAAKVSPPRMGWRVVARKEFADHLLSRRFVILVVLVGLAAVTAVYSGSGGIRSAAESINERETPAVFIRLYAAARPPIPTFFGLVGLLAPILGIAFGFDSVSSERSQGTLPRLLSQPIHRDDVINGKFAAGLGTIALILALLTALVGGVGVFRLGIVPSAAEVGRILAYLVVAIVYAGFWLAFSTFLSVVLRRAATSVIAALAAWLVLTIFAGLLINLLANAIAPIPEEEPRTVEEVRQFLRNARVEQNLSRISPTYLYQDATVVLLNPDVTTLDQEKLIFQQLDPGQRALPSELSLDQSLLIVWPQVVALVALTALCFAGAYISFMRQEVRA